MKPISKYIAALGILILGVFMAQPAFAAESFSASIAAVTPIGPDAQNDSVLSLDPFMVTIIFGLLIPIVNGIVTKASTPSGVKAILTIILSAVAALINNAATEGGGAVISEQTLKSWGLQLIVSITMYAGLYKPLGVSSTPNSDGTARLANVGVTDKGG